MGAQPVGQPFDIGHGKGPPVPRIPHGLVHIAQVKGGSLKGVVLLYCQRAEKGDIISIAAIQV